MIPRVPEACLRACSRSLRSLAVLAAGLGVGVMLGAPSRAQGVACEVRPSRAYVGQTIRYYVQIKDVEKATIEAPQAPGLQFQLEEEGRTNVMRQLSIINGRRTERETGDYVFVYAVTGDVAGTYVIAAPTVQVDGRARRGVAQTLVLEEASRQDHLLVEMRAEPPNLVQGQDGSLIVEVFLKELPPGLETRDPLAVYDRGSLFDRGKAPPVVSLPWLVQPTQGLGKVDLQSWVEARQARQGGLPLTGVRGGRFVESGGVSKVTRAGADGIDATYQRLRFTLPIRGEVAGRYDIAAASAEGDIVVREGRGLVWKTVFARSAPLLLRVTEPPSEGRPTTFTGAVGAFHFGMEPPTPTTVRVGDPIFVTLVVRGEGFLKGVNVDLAAQLGADFEVQGGNVLESLPPGETAPAGFPNRPGRWRQFDFKVIPLREGIDALPPVEFSWFDPAKSAYATERTPNVPLTVRSAGVARPVAGELRGGATDVELIPTAALSANVTDLNRLANDYPDPWPYLWLATAFPGIYTACAFVLQRQRRRRRDPALVRREKAGSRVRERLAHAGAFVGSDARRAIEEAHGALRGYVADLENRAEEALTPQDVTQWFAERGLSSDQQRCVGELGDSVEALSFGGAVPKGPEVELMLAQLSAVVRATVRLRGARVTLSLAVGLFGLSAPALAQGVDAFERANQLYENGDPAGAARLLEGMSTDDYESGVVLYNLGNCHLRAGAIGRAIAAYRRASLYLPRDANLEVNLRRALDARKTRLSPVDARTWLDYVFFWRRDLPFVTQARWALVALGLAFAAAMVRLWVGSRGAGLRVAIGVALVIAALFGTSATLHYRRLAERSVGVLVLPTCPLRSGPGESYEPSYEQPLTEGTEGEVLATREDWAKIRAGGRYVGWVPLSALALW